MQWLLCLLCQCTVHSWCGPRLVVAAGGGSTHLGSDVQQTLHGVVAKEVQPSTRQLARLCGVERGARVKVLAEEVRPTARQLDNSKDITLSCCLPL
jgi:hypothetical protein